MNLASKAIEIDPEIPNFHCNRGLIKINMADGDGAMLDMSRTLELDENFADALRYRGIIFAQGGNIAGACDDWKKASFLGDTQSTNHLQAHSDACD